MANDSELSGRVAIVTGAGRNIGRAIALDLAAAGAAIIVNAKSNRAEAEAVAAEIERGGGRAVAWLADVTDAIAVERMVAAAAERFGRVDFLVNNAAVRTELTIDEMTLGDWHKILGIILDGAFNCVKACLPHLRASGVGAVVNLGGLSAHTGAKDRAHVVTAKAGFVGLTRALAHDLAADNITVNCVSPGAIATTRAPGARRPSHGLLNRAVVGRPGASEDIAAAVRFLCGPGARYVTGQTIHINGGAFLG